MNLVASFLWGMVDSCTINEVTGVGKGSHSCPWFLLGLGLRGDHFGFFFSSVVAID